MSQSPIKRDWMRIALVAVGSNQPNGEDTPPETVRRAGRAIESESVLRVRKSALYSTPAFPERSGPDYINACWMLETSLSPIELLDHLHTTEHLFSRRRDVRWGARTLDLDLLVLGDEVLPDTKTQTHWREMPLEKRLFCSPEVLILPHPRIQDRPFVLVPLNAVAPEWRHPMAGQTAAEMLERLPRADLEAIIPVSQPAQNLAKGEDRG